jgi:hypothetical protein
MLHPPFKPLAPPLDVAPHSLRTTALQCSVTSQSPALGRDRFLSHSNTYPAVRLQVDFATEMSLKELDLNGKHLLIRYK